MPARRHGSRPGRPGTGPHAASSMVLLTSLGEGALDEGYARAAERKASGSPPSRGGPLLLATGLLAVGLLLTTAAAQARERAPLAAEARTALAEEIEDRTETIDRLEAVLVERRAAVSRARRSELRITAEGSRLARTLTTLESSTGAGAVSGPGMTVRLTETAPDEEEPETDTDPRAGSPDDGRVSDRDLQTVVNEVWAAGAEAVAINDQRLTSLSAIRSAGEAVLVDFRPLSPPYEVAAVGPPSMRSRFLDGFGGSYLQVLRDYGIDFAVDGDDELLLPASAAIGLRYATAPSDVTSGATPDPRETRSTP